MTPVLAPSTEVAERPGELRWGRVLLAVAVLVSLLWTPLAFQFLLREFISDIHYSDANSWVATARALPTSLWQRQYQAFSEAREGFRRSIRVNLFNGQAYEGMAFAHAGLGRVE